MGKLKIVGGDRLQGEVSVSGAKNAVLPIMAACLLTSEPCTIYPVPALQDVLVMRDLLEFLGARVELCAGQMRIEARDVVPQEVSQDLMRRLRASNLVLGPLLSRFHWARIAYPGGCDIGSRPMDLHLKGLAAMGAEIGDSHGFISAQCARLQPADIQLDFPSVGATENLMMAAVLAEGTTIIRNVAKEPEIVDLQNFLNSIGARVRGAGLDTIRVDGVNQTGGVVHQLIPDRIEAGTHLVAAAITQGEVVVRDIIPEHVEAMLAKLREAGIGLEVYADAVRVTGRGRPRPVDIKTLPYPGFPTDMQPQMVSLLALADGTSTVTENIFEKRFKYVDELRRMGAEIKVEGRMAVIIGVDHLSGAVVQATDLRAAAGLVLAGLAAENTTVVEDTAHLDRGYERLDAKYNSLGANIARLP
ncbi:MAG: UDP-N-acetylglucosamine 1-carboxyvinyltransferase [Clostridia bacterium]|nr:MAG: UDP-N-acetylglucosamine 1-carboxyvinyltransferase [Clostridia bacterium]